MKAEKTEKTDLSEFIIRKKSCFHQNISENHDQKDGRSRIETEDKIFHNTYISCVKMCQRKNALTHYSTNSG